MLSRFVIGAAAGAAFFTLAGPAAAAVKPHALFSDGAVLQQGMPVPVWGTAADGEKVTVSIQNRSASTVAKNGKWMVRLGELKAGGPFKLTIHGSNTIEVKDVLVGEVWICSGQSNMQWALSQSANPETHIPAANHPQIRLLTVPRRAVDAPEDDVNATWSACTPDVAKDFSAVGYFFGRDLHRALKVPVGLISTNYGGSPAEAWTRRDILEREFPTIVAAQRARERAYPLAMLQYELAMNRWREALREGRPSPAQPGRPVGRDYIFRPSGLYNAMIAPLVPYAMRGAVWYQGESNAGRAWEYRTLMRRMIENWREDWGQKEFAFHQVQLAPFMKIEPQPTESAWAELRESQALVEKVLPNCGIAVITDVGEENDIHPRKKEPVGARLALAALGITYGKHIEYSGPEYRSVAFKHGEAYISFAHVGQGLEARGARLTGFTICGADRKWVNAQAEVVGSQVKVWAPEVKEPVAVRFGWANFPVVNLWNKAGLPAAPFRTDDFPLTTQPK